MNSQGFFNILFLNKFALLMFFFIINKKCSTKEKAGMDETDGLITCVQSRTVYCVVCIQQNTYLSTSGYTTNTSLHFIKLWC